MKKLVCRPPNPARLLPLATLAGLILVVLMAMSLAPWLTPSSRAQSTSCNSAWNIVSSPNPGTASSNNLNGVAAVSPTDVWAVGFAGSIFALQAQTLIEHWDGNTWSVVQSPNPSSYSFLSSVAAVSFNDVWAVGFSSSDSAKTFQTLVEHWDGNTWSVVQSPSPGTSDNLSSVSAVSPNDVWAVGSSPSNSGPANQTLVEHWGGNTWSVVPGPSPGTSDNLSSVSAVSPNDVWAVGSSPSNSGPANRTLVEHWDGNTWSVVPSPSPGTSDNLSSVFAASSNDAWAVGSSSSDSAQTFQTLVEHWDGSSWSIVASPSPDQSDLLQAVSAVSSNDAWAVGQRAIVNTGGIDSALIEHWDGSHWSVVTSPIPSAPHSELKGVAAISSSNIWAVGDVTPMGGTNSTLTEHWDGNSWQIVSSPSVSGAENLSSLTGVAAASAGDIWAVGFSGPAKGGPGGQTLVEHFCAAAPTATPTPPATPAPQPAVSPTPAQLPATGGPPDGRGWAIWTYVLIAAGSGVALSGVAWRLRKAKRVSGQVPE